MANFEIGEYVKFTKSFKKNAAAGASGSMWSYVSRNCDSVGLINFVGEEALRVVFGDPDEDDSVKWCFGGAWFYFLEVEKCTALDIACYKVRKLRTDKQQV